MTINYEIASFIYDEISRMTDLPLYITGHDGEILCGCDRAHAGASVPAAAQAVQSGERRRLDGRQAPHLKGVALPVSFQGRCIGAALVTGDAARYEGVLPMLSFAVDVLAERAISVRKGAYRSRMVENWVVNLFDEEYRNWDELAATAQSLGISIDTAATVAVFRVARRDNASGSLAYSDPGFVENLIFQSLRRLVKINFYCYLGSNQYVYSIGSGTSRTHLMVNLREELHEALEAVVAKLAQLNMRCIAGIGSTQSTLRGYRESYLQARKSVELSQRFEGQYPIMHVYDWGLLYFLSQIPPRLVGSFAAQYFAGAPALREELAATLSAFFADNCAVQRTADRLNIHKNTLLYRLRRVKELWGLDPQNFRDALVLQMLLYFRQLYPELLAGEPPQP